MVADGDARQRVEFGAARGRVEGRGDPLAPGRRAQPGEIDDVGLLGQCVRAIDRLAPDGLLNGIEEHRLRELEQRVDHLRMTVR